MSLTLVFSNVFFLAPMLKSWTMLNMLSQCNTKFQKIYILYECKVRYVYLLKLKKNLSKNLDWKLMQSLTSWPFVFPRFRMNKMEEQIASLAAWVQTAVTTTGSRASSVRSSHTTTPSEQPSSATSSKSSGPFKSLKTFVDPPLVAVSKLC